MNVKERYFNTIKNTIQSNKNYKFKDGQVVRYAILNSTSKNLSLVSILGKNYIANVETGAEKSGLARVSFVDGKFILSPVKNSFISASDSVNISFVQTEKNYVANLLSSSGIKPSNKNIKYLEIILRHMPNISEYEKGFVLSSISRGIYISANDLLSVFNGGFYHSIFAKMKNKLNAAKVSNKNQINTENLVKLMHKDMFVDDLNMRSSVSTNNYFSVWFMLFESLLQQGDSDGLLNDVALMLKLLSSNKRGVFLKRHVYLIPISCAVNGELKTLNLFISSDKWGRASEMLLSMRNDLGCELVISHDDETYSVLVRFYDRALYEMYELVASSVLDDVSKICSKYSLNIKIGHCYEE